MSRRSPGATCKKTAFPGRTWPLRRLRPGNPAWPPARPLGIRTLLFHAYSGVLSALGMGLADEGWQGSADGGRRTLSDSALTELEPEVR